MNTPSISSTPHRRAIVIGASRAGHLAARVLSEYFTEVVLLERDALPDPAAPRKSTPHAVHPHGLLARGRQTLAASRQKGAVLTLAYAAYGYGFHLRLR